MQDYFKIGYVPYAADLSHPDDRRRFPYFAKRNNVSYEIADTNKVYDIILLPAPANLSQWLLYKMKHPRTKFIFEMVDSLVYQSDTFNTLFKGVGRFMTGKETLPWPNHKNLLIKWLKMADVVMCSSLKLKYEVEKWNSNVVLSLDYLEHEYKFLKTDYSINGKMKLVWEGQGVVLPQFLHFKEAFKQVSDFCELHVVTSEKYPRYGKFMNQNVDNILNQLPIDTIFHKWDMNQNNTLFSNFDCAVIPLNKKDVYGWHKPANKLISFWFSGLPTLTSDTPAYTDLVMKTGEDMLCANTADWVEKIHKMRDTRKEDRELLAKKNYSFAMGHYSNKAHDSKWLCLFESLQQYQPTALHSRQSIFTMDSGTRRKPELIKEPSFA